MVIVVIVAVLVALCVGFAIGRYIRPSTTVSPGNSSTDPDVQIHGGAATAMLTDDIKTCFVYESGPELAAHPVGIAWPPNVHYMKHLEVYSWITNGQFFAKCGVECSKMDPNKYNDYSECEARIGKSANLLTHHTLIFCPDDEQFIGAFLGLGLTYFEQIGHALLYNNLQALTNDLDVTAISHAHINDWPACAAESGSECFTHVSNNSNIDHMLFASAVCTTVDQLCEFGQGLLNLQDRRTLPVNFEMIKLPGWDIDVNKMDRSHILNHAVVAVTILRILSNMDMNEQSVCFNNRTPDQWARIWHAVSVPSTNQNYTIEGLPRLINPNSNIMTPFNSCNFTNNGAVNILEAVMYDPLVTNNDNELHANVVLMNYRKNPDYIIDPAHIDRLMEYITNLIQNTGVTGRCRDQTATEVSMFACVCTNTVINLMNQNLPDDVMFTICDKCVRYVTYIADVVQLEKLKNTRTIIGKTTNKLVSNIQFILKKLLFNARAIHNDQLIESIQNLLNLVSIV